MPSQPSSTAPDTAAPADDAAANEDTHYYRRVLHELIDLGADIARMVHQNAKAQAEAAPDGATAPDPTVAFDRISRAIRRTITLARHLDDPVPARTAIPAAQNRIAARKRILRSVEDAIERMAGYAEAESLNAELLDRMDSPDLEDDLAHRPIADIIADICADLGLATIAGYNPCKRRTPADIAALCAYAALPPAPHPGETSPLTGSDPPSRADESRPTLLYGTTRFRSS